MAKPFIGDTVNLLSQKRDDDGLVSIDIVGGQYSIVSHSDVDNLLNNANHGAGLKLVGSKKTIKYSFPSRISAQETVTVCCAIPRVTSMYARRQWTATWYACQRYNNPKGIQLEVLQSRKVNSYCLV
ncbi:uncharacterized protein BJ212DRAFT_1295727 [Suillus subaureus]|uniref:Uncharacterized protein n=1 Tax=Suillus subaureus TaxID=48587 RepID=A0A9P7JIJ9_9AGAM|nr:uncharacterized protein BJ212DRAFT_1295727 [Suillus subaureus]KAG1824593.1 hypothetical protein BJ212DRAFT_1295727 [Suillus subaureus]